MSFKILVTERFKKEAKRLLKKFPSLKQDLIMLQEDLLHNPTQGTPLGQDVYKVLLAIKSKGRGKSGGARVITYVLIRERELYLLTIYDKSDMETVDDKTLRKIISDLREEE